MIFKKIFATLILISLGLSACGKNLSEILFHKSVDDRSQESLSGSTRIPSSFTLPDPEKFNFAVFGDVQMHADGKTLLTRFKNDVQLNDIQFFVVLGDLTEDATPSEYEMVKSALDDVGVPYYVTLGNHDLFQDPSKGGWSSYKSTFGAATYSVSFAESVRIIFLDTASGNIGQNQFDWLQKQLSTHVPFTFVVSHYPIYDGVTPIIWRIASVEERYKLTKILDDGGVYAYAGGHIHGYRSNQVSRFKHFITGSMYPYDLDYGTHGYLLFTYDHGSMSSRFVAWSDL